MLKLYRNILAGGFVALGLAACGDKVTVTQSGPSTVIHSVTVAPSTLTVALNTPDAKLFTASVSVDSVTATNTAVDWSSSVPAVATVGADGTIHVVAAGQTAIIAKSHLDPSKSGAATLIVTATNAASISINTINTGASGGTSGCPGTPGLPVLLSNVACQIDVGLNLSAGGQSLDYVAVYIIPTSNTQSCTDLKTSSIPAALQSFGNSVPSTGFINLSVNTAAYGKNRATASDTVYYTNGLRNLVACLYATGGSASSVVVNTNNVQSINLVNVDGWAADIMGDTFLGSSPAPGTLPTSAVGANGLTYWGGPSATGKDSVIYYPVIFTQGRSVAAASLGQGPGGVAGCTVSAQTNAVAAAAVPNTTRQVNKGFARSFGYTAAPSSATTACTTYENTGGLAGPRDNVLVTLATDNFTNTFPGVNAAEGLKLISNTVTFGSTPDSLRFDWKAPTVTTPVIARTAPSVTGWVNTGFSFNPGASTDGGVGVRTAADRAFFYDNTNCTAPTTGLAIATTAASSIPECSTNFIGGAVGLGAPGTAPYRVFMTESDRLANVGTSGKTNTFGVDNTNPNIRWGTTVDASLTLPIAYGGNVADPVDSVRFQTAVVKAAGVFGEFRAEYLDDRSGFFNAGQPTGGAAAQSQTLAAAGHLNPLGVCQIGTAPVGATFVTNPGCAFVPITAGTAGVRIDGWQPGQRLNVPLPEGYYGYKTWVRDEAGNQSVTLFRRVLINNQSPFTTGLAVPATLTSTNFTFNPTFSDSAEIVKQSLQLTYPFAAATIDSFRYNQGTIGTAFDDVITSPFTGPISPTTGAPFAHSMEQTTAAVFPATNVNVAGVQAKPTQVQAWSWNVGSTFGAGAPAPGVSLLIAIPGLNVEANNNMNAFNVANPTTSIDHFRIITTVASTNQFGSTVPLRAQVKSPTNSPNPPFARVDFYRLVGGAFWSYLGSAPGNAVQLSTACTTTAGVCGTDQGTYRSWVYQLPVTYVGRWDGVAQTVAASGDVIIAVGVVASGDALVTQLTTMTP